MGRGNNGIGTQGDGGTMRRGHTGSAPFLILQTPMIWPETANFV